MMETAKMGFFTRIKKAVFKFDEYDKFINEGTKQAFKYFFKLISIFSLIITIALMCMLNTDLERTVNILKTEFPNFEFVDGNLKLEDVKIFEYYLENLDLQLIVTNEDVQMEKIKSYNNCLTMVQDKMIVKYGNFYFQDISYKNIQLENVSKQEIIDMFRMKNLLPIYITSGALIFLINFMLYTIILILDTITLTILGLVINILIKSAFKFVDIFKVSVYSMTLPIILYLIYSVLNIIFGITIKYFQIAYNTIGYIYLITVLLILKSDMIKNMQELQKIQEEQKKVKQELEREKQKDKETKDDEEKEESKENNEQKKKHKQGNDEPQVEN